MRRNATIGSVVLLSLAGFLCGDGQAGKQRDEVIADHLFTVTDDFIIDIYHKGVKVPDSKRTLLEERFGATAERIEIDVKKGYWLVFNMVDNRIR